MHAAQLNAQCFQIKNSLRYTDILVSIDAYIKQTSFNRTIILIIFRKYIERLYRITRSIESNLNRIILFTPVIPTPPISAICLYIATTTQRTSLPRVVSTSFRRSFQFARSCQAQSASCLINCSPLAAAAAFHRRVETLLIRPVLFPLSDALRYRRLSSSRVLRTAAYPAAGVTEINYLVLRLQIGGFFSDTFNTIYDTKRNAQVINIAYQARFINSVYKF